MHVEVAPHVPRLIGGGEIGEPVRWTDLYQTPLSVCADWPQSLRPALPGVMNGPQVADATRAQRPSLPVLYITGCAENPGVRNGHLEPGMELLTKPLSSGALATKVGDIIKGDGAG